MVNKVFLVGFMGCGKTTIGKYIARDMGWTFIDMDNFFVDKYNCSIKEFFATKGEDEFRKAEHAIVEELCTMENIVVATGGGAPCYYDNMELINKSGLSIYISVEPSILSKRLVNAKSERPLIADKDDSELTEYIKSKLAEREPFYRKARMITDGEAVPFSNYRSLIEMFPEDLYF
jgi:shikimate kinase